MFINLKIYLYSILTAWILAVVNFQFVTCANLKLSNRKKKEIREELCGKPYYFENEKSGRPVYVRYTIHSDDQVIGKYIGNVLVKAIRKKNTLKRGSRIARNKFKHNSDGSRYYLKFRLPESKSYIFCYQIKSEKGNLLIFCFIYFIFRFIIILFYLFRYFFYFSLHNHFIIFIMIICICLFIYLFIVYRFRKLYKRAIG